jgi:DNA-binding response OmpR family regulator
MKMSERERERALVLVADDEADIRELVGHRMKQAGYDVITAADGKEGLKAIREQSPDLVILDVKMPHLTGYEVTRRIREDSATRDIPVLLLSASVHEDEVAQGLEAGADSYLRKPFRPAELRERVASLLQAGMASS